MELLTVEPPTCIVNPGKLEHGFRMIGAGIPIPYFQSMRIQLLGFYCIVFADSGDLGLRIVGNRVSYRAFILLLPP